jgi:type VI secretion system secreted protein Hcp
MAAENYFLKIDGVEGESADARHRGEIDIESWAWGEVRSSDGGGGPGPIKVQMQGFQFAMKLSKASPKLLIACATGEHFRVAVLTGQRAGGSQLEFLKITMTDVIVTSFQTGGSRGAESSLLDQVALSFAKIEYEYRAQKPDGTADAPIKVGWDLKMNKKV